MNDQPHRRWLLQWAAAPAAAIAAGLPHAAMAALSGAAASAPGAGGAPGGAELPLIDTAFGAVGDGVTDDTAAILRAFRSAKPFRFGPKTYVYKGLYRIDVALVEAYGVPSQTRLLRRGSSPAETYAGLLFQAATVILDGVIFDGGGALANNPWNVVVTAPAARVEITRCRFTEARGNLGIGLGLFGAPQVQPQSHTVDDCEFDNCDNTGLMLSAITTGQVTRNRVHDVRIAGIAVASFDADDYQPAHPYAGKVRTERLMIGENLAWNCGQVGMSVSAGQPPVYKDPHHPSGWPMYGAPVHPEAFRTVVRDNFAWDCGSYGLSVAGDYINVEGNILGRINGCPAALNTSGYGVGMFGCMLSGGMRWSRIAGNIAVGYDAAGARSVPWGFDIGSGGNWGLIEDNILVGIDGAGLNLGAAAGLTARNNICYDCRVGISVWNLESDGTAGGMDNVFATGFWLAGNRCFLSRGQSGIIAMDNPQGAIRGNDFVSLDGFADPVLAIAANGGAIEVSENTWNTSRRWPATLNQAREMIVPDGADEVVVNAPRGTAIAAVFTHTASEVRSGIGWVTMGVTGSGYSVADTTMTVVDSSGHGSGAVLQPWIWNGGIIGARVSQRGSGYSPATTTLSIRGSGRGAAGMVNVGIPIPRAKWLRLIFAEAGSVSGVPVPRHGVISLTEINGGWSVPSH
jgi:hypothetical protein